ncbi:MAG TPA: septum formation initiator family protein, partial [Acidimicrobiales bacterium]|nr:septum formation initiator family protein [Acidimicrobiales bacterium]
EPVVPVLTTEPNPTPAAEAPAATPGPAAPEPDETEDGRDATVVALAAAAGPARLRYGRTAAATEGASRPAAGADAAGTDQVDEVDVSSSSAEPAGPDDLDDLDDPEGTGESGATGAPGVTVLRPLAGMGNAAASKVASSGMTAAEALKAARQYGSARLFPEGVDAREARNAKLRRAGTRVGSVAVAGVLIYAVFPVRTYLDQRAATRRAQEQIEVISEQNARLEEQVGRLDTDEEVERIAREQYGLVRPGEEPYGLLPVPQATTTTTTPPTD